MQGNEKYTDACYSHGLFHTETITTLNYILDRGTCALCDITLGHVSRYLRATKQHMYDSAIFTVLTRFNWQTGAKPTPGVTLYYGTFLKAEERRKQLKTPPMYQMGDSLMSRLINKHPNPVSLLFLNKLH